MRNIDKEPYSKDEARVARFFYERGTGGGDDPIGALIASHEYLIAERKSMPQSILKMAIICGHAIELGHYFVQVDPVDLSKIATVDSNLVRQLMRLTYHCTNL
jgi:hypothetical protein